MWRDGDWNGFAGIAAVGLLVPSVNRDGDALGVGEDLLEDGRGHRRADAAVAGVDVDPREVEDRRLDVDLHALAGAEALFSAAAGIFSVSAYPPAKPPRRGPLGGVTPHSASAGLSLSPLPSPRFRHSAAGIRRVQPLPFPHFAILESIAASERNKTAAQRRGDFDIMSSFP